MEAPTEGSTGSRSDLSFSYGGEHRDVELKTCNTNWRMEAFTPQFNQETLRTELWGNTRIWYSNLPQ